MIDGHKLCCALLLGRVQFFLTPWTVARLLCPWDSSGKNTGVVCHALLQGIFPSQGLNLGFPHYRLILYCLSQGSECKLGDNNFIPQSFFSLSLSTHYMFSNIIVFYEVCPVLYDILWHLWHLSTGCQ